MLLTATAGYLKSDNRFTSPVVGRAEPAWSRRASGASARRAAKTSSGCPTSASPATPASTRRSASTGRLWSDVQNAKASLTWVRGGHSLSAGYEFNDRSVYGRHGSHSPRGSFDFNGQYTGDGFADFLLGLTSGTRRNFPLETFGLDSSPYSGAFVQDFWKVRSNLTARPRPALRVLARQVAARRQRRDVRSGDRQGHRRRGRETARST